MEPPQSAPWETTVLRRTIPGFSFQSIIALTGVSGWAMQLKTLPVTPEHTYRATNLFVPSWVSIFCRTHKIHTHRHTQRQTQAHRHTSTHRHKHIQTHRHTRTHTPCARIDGSGGGERRVILLKTKRNAGTTLKTLHHGIQSPYLKNHHDMHGWSFGN